MLKHEPGCPVPPDGWFDPGKVGNPICSCPEVTNPQEDAELFIVKVIRQRIEYGKKYRLTDLRNGFSSIESGPCCDKCVMKQEHLTGRGDAIKAFAGCRNPFQLPEVCECHIPFRRVAEESIQKSLENILFNALMDVNRYKKVTLIKKRLGYDREPECSKTISGLHDSNCGHDVGWAGEPPR